jgi:hypothetical protein
MRRSTRSVAILGVFVLLATTFIVGIPSSAVHASSKASLTIVFNGPVGMRRQLVIGGRIKKVVIEDGTTKAERVKISVPTGSFRFRATSAVFNGSLYRPSVNVAQAKLRARDSKRIVVSWKRVVLSAGLEVTVTTLNSIGLTWSSKSAVEYQLSKMLGESPPRRRGDGSLVYRGKAKSATDVALQPGERYSYSLFVKVAIGEGSRKTFKWLGPVSVTAGTRKIDANTGQQTPSYSVAPNAVIVDPTDTDVATVVNGQVWVKLARSRPTPVLGSGVGLPQSTQFPGGYIGVVVEIAADQQSVRLEPGGVGDLFDHFAIKGSFSSGDVDASPTNYGSYDPNAPATGQVAAASVRRQSSVKRCDEVSYSRDLSISVDPMFNGSGDFDIYWHKTTVGIWKLKTDVPYAVSVDLTASLEVGATFNVKLRYELSCLLGIEDFRYPVTMYPIPMALEYSGGIEVRGYGQLELNNWGFNATVGFRSSVRLGLDSLPSHSGDIFKSANAYEPIAKGEVGVEVALTGNLTFGPGAGTNGLGAIAGVSGEVSPWVGRLAGQFGDPALGQPKCLEISNTGSASLAVSAKAWIGSVSKSADFVLADGGWTYGNPYRYPTSCKLEEELGSGDVQVTLRWSNGTDYDLRVVDPAGQEIYYSRKRSSSGGELDADIIPGCRSDTSDGSFVENVVWKPNTAPAGVYTVRVAEFTGCAIGPRSWSLEVKVNGRRVLFTTGIGSSTTSNFTVEARR